MDGVIRIYPKTADDQDACIEIGFTVSKRKNEEFIARLLKVLKKFKTKPNFE